MLSVSKAMLTVRQVVVNVGIKYAITRQEESDSTDSIAGINSRCRANEC